MKKLLFIEHHHDFRHAVKAHLNSYHLDLHVIEARSARDGLALAKKECPEIVLLDIHLPGAKGLDLADRLKEIFPDVQIIVLTFFESPKGLPPGREKSVRAFIPKTELGEKLFPLLKTMTVD